MDLSIVVPVFNEEDNVEKLSQRITDSLEGEGLDYEVIFVDDGSTDGTVDKLRQLASRNRTIQVVKLRKNYGQTPAMRAGIDQSRGEVIVTMDGDLQNDPKDIPLLLSKLEEGFDLVAGWRKDRKDRLLSRKVPSRIANWIIARITGVPIHDNGCSLKAYRADLIKKTPLYSEMHRFIPAMTTLAGSRIAEVAVSHHPRCFGVSKYGLSRTGKVILDLFTVKMLIAFSQRPLHWFGVLSIPFLLLFVLTGAYAVYLMLVLPGEEVTIIYPALCILLAFLAVQLLFTGLLGELTVRTGKTYDSRRTAKRRDLGC